MQLSTLDHTTVQRMGKEILNTYRERCSSFENAAQCLVEEMFTSFQSSEGKPEFALVRVFRILNYAKLPSDLQAITKASSGQVLALMGTIGVEESWCDRHHSHSRQVIPINEHMSPMFKGVFHELGFSWEDSTGEEIVSGESLNAMGMIRYFYVEDASTSHHITDQKEFVKPYAIKSVIAAGSQFLSGEAYVLIGFTRVPMSLEQAELLVQLTPHISTLLAIFDAQGPLWEK